MTRQQWLVFVPMTLATAGLTACASMMGGKELQDLKVRPVETAQAPTGAKNDPLYESAVAAINDRDYGRALDYLQAEKAKDPSNVKALNALGVVYDKLGRFDLSARYYAQAKAIEPDSKIVAENMGYSKVLQHLVDPAAPVAVATVDLPPSIAAPALPAEPASTGVKASTTRVAEAPAVKPPPAPVFAAVSAAPIPQPEARRVSAPSVAYAFARQPSLTAAATPYLPAMPAALPPDNKPASATVAFAAPSVVAKPEFAPSIPPATMMPAAVPAEARPVALAPLAGSVAKTVIVPAPASAPSIQVAMAAQPVVPIVRPPERKVAAPSLFPVAPLSLKSQEISVMTMTEMEAPVPEKKPMIATAVPAVPPVLASKAAPVLSVPLPVARPQTPSAPAKAVLSAPLPEKKPLVVASLVAPPAAHQAVEKRVQLASNPPVTAKPVAPSKPAAVPAVLPAKTAIAPPVRPAPSMVKTTAMTSAPAKATPSKTAAPMKMASARPSNPIPYPVHQQVAGKKFLTIGQPVKLTNASGRANGSGPVLRRLTLLGWTMRAADGRAEPKTILYYTPKTVAAAKALQRTLPFPVRLVVDKANASGMRLVIGRDYLSWKPRNATMAALWQKNAAVATWHKASMKGAR